jgi:hypothetical protein
MTRPAGWEPDNPWAETPASEPGQLYVPPPPPFPTTAGTPTGQYLTDQPGTPISNSVPGASRPAGKSWSLGTVSLLIETVSGVAVFVAVWLIVDLLRRGLAFAGPEFSGRVSYGNTVGPHLAVIFLASLLGFIGWVLALVAVGTKRGHIFGVIAVIVGLLAPTAIGGYLWFVWTQLVPPTGR